MEYAVNDSGKRIHALDANKNDQYHCPICGKDVLPRQGELNRWHYAHSSACSDTWNYDMSEWHQNWQRRFPEECREVVVTYNGEQHRADILIENHVIEFQHSPITPNEVMRRNNFYRNAGYQVIWVFDETTAFNMGNIVQNDRDDTRFDWKYANKSISCICPQEETDIAVVLQLTESAENESDEEAWLVKVDWAIKETSNFVSYRVFFGNTDFSPDFFTTIGRQHIMLNRRGRFQAFLRENGPYSLKCGRFKGNPRPWYICEQTKDWHNEACKYCRYNLITEERMSSNSTYRKPYFYCCFPRVVSEVDCSGSASVPSIIMRSYD